MNFVWQDLIAFLGVFYSALDASRTTPGFPSHKYLARFVNGLHVAVIVAIFAAMSASSVSLMSNVSWVQNKLCFPIPLFGYAIVVVMTMIYVVASSIKVVLSQSYVYSQKKYFIPITIFIGLFDLSILFHMLSIF